MAFCAVQFSKICEMNYTQSNSKVVSFREESSLVIVTVITCEEMPAARMSSYKPQLLGEKAKGMRSMTKYEPDVDKMYYIELFNMNDSEVDADVPNVDRLVDEVPMPLACVPVDRCVLTEVCTDAIAHWIVQGRK